MNLFSVNKYSFLYTFSFFHVTRLHSAYPRSRRAPNRTRVLHLGTVTDCQVGSSILSPKPAVWDAGGHRRRARPLHGNSGMMWLSSGSTAFPTCHRRWTPLWNSNCRPDVPCDEIFSHGRSVASVAFNSLRFTGGAFAPITAGYLGQTYSDMVPFALGAAVVVLGFGILLGRFSEFQLFMSTGTSTSDYSSSFD
jgi:hypothetical protein